MANMPLRVTDPDAPDWSRRGFVGFAGAVALAAGLPGCAPAIGAGGHRYGWEATRRLEGRYRVLVYEPTEGHTTPIFVVLLTKTSEPRARIWEPYGVTDLGERSAEDVVNGLKARYPNLRSSDVEVQDVVVDVSGRTVGHVIKTRLIDVYAYYDGRAGEYQVRLSGPGKQQPRGGRGGGGGR